MWSRSRRGSEDGSQKGRLRQSAVRDCLQLHLRVPFRVMDQPLDQPLFRMTAPLENKLEEGRQRIRAAVANESEQYVQTVDVEEWAHHLADLERRDPPVLGTAEPELEELGEVQADVTGLPGITMSSIEMFSGQQISRPGRRFKLVVSVRGEGDLLRFRPSAGAEELDAWLSPDEVVATWDWPLERGPKLLEEEVQSFFGALRIGTERVASDVRAFNSALVSFAKEVIAERQTAIGKQYDFLDSISLPVKRRADAPQTFSIPAVVERPSPARRVVSEKPQPLTTPMLGELYDHILDIARAMGRAMERTPGEYAQMDEERLRDSLLVILNSHYRGQAQAEAFNKGGKTDVLIRVHDNNLFIAECKWWSGELGMGKALDQLYGYSTWRDSRLALVCFVGAKDVTAIVDKARDFLERRDEFVKWEGLAHDRELRCRIRWPGDSTREAILTVLFFHLQKS
jgi:hypothetical protein